jgi:hypothetical protein
MPPPEDFTADDWNRQVDALEVDCEQRISLCDEAVDDQNRDVSADEIRAALLSISSHVQCCR